ncbi:MAG: aminopeptidase P family protein [Acidobacteriaceae bacterium]|nr:aminopeptidase P family protein [Acidobacteriaceae bacterium]MBV9766846.1 aminopeptidase P family protein [Acidobacteriaceae bacterium]
MIISRRSLIRFAGGCGGVLVVGRLPNARAEEAVVPPSIGALTSMRDQARPISTDERRERIAKAQRLMSERKMDALLLPGGTSLQYFTGARWGNSERLFAVVIPLKGKAFSVCPSFEEDRAREQLNQGPLEGAEVLTWHEDENPYRLVANGLKSRGISTGVLGVEEKTPYVFMDGIAQIAPALNIVSATPVTAGCRMIKSEHELQLMSIANQATLKVYEAVYRALQPGMTQKDAGALIGAAYGRVGFPGEASVQVGPYTALPHGSAASQVIGESTIVMIDDGCTVDGYNSDITRTFVLGKASDKMKRVFDIVHRAQSAALRAAKPGVECQAVDAAARKLIADADFGPDYKYFTHRVGHGIGMDGHEWPYLVRGNSLPLSAGMTFSDEPGIYIRGEFGVRLEDDMHITETGAELFTPQSPSLEHPFG